MSYQAVTIEQFPGLDLRADPGDASGAIDAMNVTTERGAIRSRDGSTAFFSPTGVPCFLFNYNDSQLIVASRASPANLYAVSNAGVTVASTTTPAIFNADFFSGVAIGTSANSYVYVSAGNVIKRWDGATWTAPGGMPANPGVLSMSPTDNRLIVCSASKVSFSDPGAPETYGANNYAYLVPGDGEAVNGAAVFNNQTFIFKRTKFFVFYGQNKGPTGDPEFNYRTVDAGVGMHSVAPQSVCAGSDGVYFIGADGIYRTTGGPAVKISAPIDPFFVGNIGPYWQGATFNAGITGATFLSTVRLGWVNNRLYAGLGTSAASVTPGVTMVYDAQLQTWSVWSVHSGAIVGFPRSTATGDERTVFLASVGVSKILKVTSGVSADDGTAIVSRYRLPFESYGKPGEKRLRETIVEGTGSPTVQWSKDWGSLVTGSAVTLGTSPALATSRQRSALRGRTFSPQIGASSGAWAVNRVQANISDAIRPVVVAR